MRTGECWRHVQASADQSLNDVGLLMRFGGMNQKHEILSACARGAGLVVRAAMHGPLIRLDA